MVRVAKNVVPHISSECRGNVERRKSMAKWVVIDRQGRRREVDDDYILADGETSYFGMVMMDAASRTATDKADEAFDARSRRMASAWRGADRPREEEPDEKEEEKDDDEDEAVNDAEAAYDARSLLLQDAWRGPQARQPRPARQVKATDVDAAYYEHSAWLQGAWKGSK
jgi:hypothetical protein